MFSKRQKLKEVPNLRQIPGMEPRRWFASKNLNLIVWYSQQSLSGFQLSYFDGSEEKALTWRKDKGYSHNRIDDGEACVGKPKKTPMLLADGDFDQTRVLALFDAECSGLPAEIAAFVRVRVCAYKNPQSNR